MPKRVVLAYSGGLDTSVAVRWMIDNLGVEVIALAVNVGQDGGTIDEATIRTRAEAAGAVECIIDDARDEFARDFLVPALKANALYEGKYPLVSALSRPVIVQASRRRGAHARRRCGRARLHRQGQRPGALRGVDARARARPRCRRARPVVGDDPRGLHPLRVRPRHPDHRDEGEAVLDRRQPLGPGDRVRRDGGPVASPAAGRVVVDEADRDRAARPRRSDSTRAFRSSVDGESRSARRAHRAGRFDRRFVRLGPARHGREPSRRHQEPRDLRVPVGPRADRCPRRSRVDHPRTRPRSREAAARDQVRRARLRRPVVLAAPSGARRVHRREPAIRHRRGAPASRARLVPGDRPAQRAQPLRLRPRHLRQRRTCSGTRTRPGSSVSGASVSRRGRPSRARRNA